MKWLIDGSPGLLDPADRGLAYGDGVFETIVFDGRQLVFWSYHLARLAKGLARLGIGAVDELALFEECSRVAGQAPCIVKIIATRGSGKRGYGGALNIAPRRIVGAFELPRIPDGPAQLRICNHRWPYNPTMAGIKHLNRLDQVIARSEWSSQEWFDGLMLDGAGRVISGTSTNVFALLDGALLTPRLDQCGVHGTLRSVIMEHSSRWGFPVREATLWLDSLRHADEVFLTNAVVGVLPVSRLEKWALATGPVAGMIAEELKNLVGMASR